MPAISRQRRKAGFSVLATSKMQRRFSRALSREFAEFTIRENARPEWCLGPSFRRLELDFWIEELNVAVEIQGKQHEIYVPHFHGDFDGFKSQVKRDNAKRQRCEFEGIELIEVYDEFSFNQALARIAELARSYHAVSAPVLNPGLWHSNLTNLYANFESLFNARHEMDKCLLVQRLSRQCEKFNQYVRENGSAIFQFIEPNKTDKLIKYAKSSYGLIATMREQIKKEKRANRRIAKARKRARKQSVQE